MIDPYDEVKEEKISYVTRAKILYELLLYIFKTILIFCSLLIVILLISFVITTEKGIIIQPFDSTEKNLSSTFIANHLIFELQSIKEINDKELETPKIPLEGSNVQTKSGNIPPFLLQASTLANLITDLGDVRFEGISLSIGHLILSIKKFFGSSTPVITGSIQGSKSELRIIAILDDPKKGITAWEIRKDISNNTNEESIDIMIEDLAFQIANNLYKNKSLPQTWEALKYYTMSRKAYVNYNITSNINYLNNSRDHALKARESEPRYSQIPILFCILGSSYMKLNKTNEAEQLFKNATDLNSSYARAWEGLGLALFSQNKYNESIKAFDRAIEHSNDNLNKSTNWYNKGNALFELGDFNGSIQAYNQAISLNSTNVDAMFNKGLSLYYINKANESVQAFKEVINLSPNDAEAWNNKGVSLHAIGEYNESIQAYDKAIALNPSYQEAYYNRGLSYAMTDRYDESIHDFNKAIELDENYTDAWNSKGRVLEAQERYEDAIKAFDKAIEINERDADAWYDKGEALELLGRLEEANESFSMANNLEQSA